MLLFDMDGTLIDSNGIWKDVDTRFLEKRGLPYTQEYYEGVAHTIFPLAAKFTKEFCHLPESEAAIMGRVDGDGRRHLRHGRNGKARCPRLSGADEEPRRAYGCGHQRGPCSLPCGADPPGPAALFRAYFLCPGAGHREKVSPPSGRRVAAALGVSPADCTLFDDSVEAIRGAKAAGMHTVGVADPYFASTADEMARTCDRYISSFGELRLYP